MKEPIALLINDIHVSKDNISEFEKNWDEMLAVCKKHSIEDVFVGGDMFTSRSSQTLSTLTAVHKALKKAINQNLSITIAEGNHDKTNPEDTTGYNHLWSGMEGIKVIDTYDIATWTGVDTILLTLSYFPENGSFIEHLSSALEVALHTYPDATKENIILYIHEGVHGALGDFDIEGELPQESLMGFKAVLCGHYHNRTKIKGTNIEYIGSSRQHNFGEDEEKGYTILYSDGSYEFVKNEVNTRYRTIDLDASELDAFKFQKDDRYKYRVKVRCNEQQAKVFDKQQLLDLGIHKVEVVAETMVSKEAAASGIQEKYDRQGIKKEYQNYCDENSIDSELGIKYLED